MSFSQSIWDYSNWKNLDRAELVAFQADANHGFAKQNLIIRTVNAYFSVLESKDDLEFAEAENAQSSVNLSKPNNDLRWD